MIDWLKEKLRRRHPVTDSLRQQALRQAQREIELERQQRDLLARIAAIDLDIQVQRRDAHP